MAWMRMMGAESVNYHRETVSTGPTTTPARPSIITPPRRDAPCLGRLGRRDLGLRVR